MNLLEHYIEEIHSVEEVERQEWMNGPYVKVDITIDCYGSIERKTTYYPLSYWESIKEKGYYMG